MPSKVKIMKSTKVPFCISMDILKIDNSISLLKVTRNNKLLKIAVITDHFKGYLVRRKRSRKNLK